MSRTCPIHHGCDYNRIHMRRLAPRVMRRPAPRVLALLMFNMLFALSAGAADLPLAGVWKLNVAKSHFSHGDLLKSLILTIEPDGVDGIQYRSKNQLVDGTSGGAAYRAKLDGNDYPVSGTPNYDAVSIERVYSRTFHVLMK